MSPTACFVPGDQPQVFYPPLPDVAPAGLAAGSSRSAPAGLAPAVPAGAASASSTSAPPAPAPASVAEPAAAAPPTASEPADAS